MKEHRGITLIALVVTIVVLIILAVISINSVFGEDGLIASAERGSIEHTHATVWEAMEMEYSNYWIDKVMLDGDLITYLQGEDKGIIGKELQGAGYVINVEKLLGTRMSLGNGTDGNNDVYKLEPLQTEETNIAKIASTDEDIKLAEESAESEYQVKYYGPSGDRVLGVLGDSIVENDNANFKVEKTVDNVPGEERQYYINGEEIIYKIRVENIGHVTIKDVEIEDELVTKSGAYHPGDPEIVLKNDSSDGRNITTEGGKFIIGDMIEGAILEFRYGYVVKAGDIGEKVKNSITRLTGDPQPILPRGHKIPPVETPVTPEEVKPDISVEKELLSPKEKCYIIGDVLLYRLTVKNTGNTRINSFEISDTITSGSGTYPQTFTEFTEPSGQTYLDIGQTGYIDYSYTVKEEDLGHTVQNMAEIVKTDPPTPPAGHKIPEVDIELKDLENCVVIEKVWQDEFGNITEPGAPVVGVDVTGPDGWSEYVELSEENNWTYVFEDMQCYWESGEPCEYTAVERDFGEVSNQYEIFEEDPTPFQIRIINRKLHLEPGALTINKRVLGGGVAAQTKTYTFHVTGPNGYSENVSITGSGKITLNDLEPGEYIVVEEDASIPGWSWSVSGEGLVSVEYFLESSMAITNVYDTPDEPDGPPPDTP